MNLDKIQKFGRYLSNMVQPNIGAFIAWGLITAFFIPTGWMPNETYAKLVGPMITYLLPLLIAYSGGDMVYKHRGAVLGVIMTIGLIVGSSVPMFLGAMIAGPLAAFLMKKVDEILLPVTPAGFEMLINNFSAGILGMILALVSLVGVAPIVESISLGLGAGVQSLVDRNLLPLVAIIVEPAKVFFLNNALNHGVFSPLGIQQVSEAGKSIFFTIETNPGPGMGVLLAYMFFGDGRAKSSASGAGIIHFFGGIHEIYFPYVLMNPLLIIALIGGGMSGIFTSILLGGGLTSVPSPGSILALLAVTPQGGFLATISSVAIATGVSFIIASPFVKTSKASIEEAQEQSKAMKITTPNDKIIRKIVVACDAGMGSSALGASTLRKIVKEAGLDFEVVHSAISNLDDSADLVLTQKTLTELAKQKLPNATHISLENFMDKDFYKSILQQISNK